MSSTFHTHKYTAAVIKSYKHSVFVYDSWTHWKEQFVAIDWTEYKDMALYNNM